MKPPVLLRRYAPLALVVCVQLLIVLIAPSKAPHETGLVDQVGAEGSVVTGEGSASSVPGSRDARAARRRVRSGASAAADGASAPIASGSLGVPTTGDTRHCVRGRQFDPKIDFYAPACVPRFTGRNSGSTYRGVTPRVIKLVDYRIQPSAATEAVWESQGIWASREEQRAFDDAVERFINTHYELYGRKVDIELYESPCTQSPPDEKCYRPDVAQVVIDKKPFFAVANSVVPMSFVLDEFSARKTLNAGGWHFPDEFNVARRPFHWDVQLSGTKMMRIFGDWYCGQFHGKPTKYAGEPRPPGESLNGKPRVIGVIAPNDPEVIAVVRGELVRSLGKCGAKVSHTYFYALDPATADQQRKAAITKMREAPETTTLVCVCGAAAVALLHEEMQEENYYPEQLMTGYATTDLDSVGQFYAGSLACPLGSNCQAENMFGLAQLGPQEQRFNGVGARVWRAAGRSGNPPHERVDIDWAYWNMVATLLQAAGPNLTPYTVEAAAIRLPALGGGASGYPLHRFTPGSYAWIQDMRVVYWSVRRPSRYNGSAGTWIQIGPRFERRSPPFSLPPKPR